LTKMQIKLNTEFVIFYRSKPYEFDKLNSFTADFIAENLWAENATR
jgi:hypothetical protein